MTLRLKGKAASVGKPDRRYYMIDVQVSNRRIRLSSGTRDKALAERRHRDVVEALQVAPQVSDMTLRHLVRGNAGAARDTIGALATQARGDAEPNVQDESPERSWACLSTLIFADRRAGKR